MNLPADTIFGSNSPEFGVQTFRGHQRKGTDMKKYLLVFGMAAFVFASLLPRSIADDNAFTKFGRGMANIVISPAELYTEPILLSKDHDTTTAFFGGLFKGVVMIVAREIVGIYEVVTFPLPIPKGYQPIIKPATVFTDWDIRQPQD